MLILNAIESYGHEQVVFLNHPPSGLRAILAIHDTTLGPAIGACRFRAYEDEEEALRDALELSRSITFKTALAGLNYGGGACIVLADAPDHQLQPHAREGLFRALGRHVDALGGRIILIEDVHVTQTDIAFAAQETRHTLGFQQDTTAATAYGVYRGIKAAARYHIGTESMRGVRIAILGVGEVGGKLAAHLAREGARLTLADSKPGRAARVAEQLGADTVPANEVFDVPCDIFSPCAFGGSISKAAAGSLQARMVAGGEHNPLAKGADVVLEEAGIAYIPDYLLNAAGLLVGTGLSLEEAAERVYSDVGWVCAEAQTRDESTHQTARRLAEQRISMIASIGSFFRQAP
ncbi:leucine dehydrogenase [Deinobacterium chartae]|uniref:Leucine dehydrogenase n=1 Tax=Deinobacterium chartae TaxID=521158 RepID=A0A841I285_9DEIO|nr:Glu/Leu/Phe/Val dehydrogenase dimerization domain-containing protein [Deinobacterium chartae]MBB6099176.1 leucine dehydrogenase [Deinobacterium chartae]